MPLSAGVHLPWRLRKLIPRYISTSRYFSQAFTGWVGQHWRRRDLFAGEKHSTRAAITPTPGWRGRTCPVHLVLWLLKLRAHVLSVRLLPVLSSFKTETILCNRRRRQKRR